jgi:hypothetical protein
MSELVITFCDLCNVNRKYDPSPSEDEQIVDADDPEVVLCNGKGYIFTDAAHAIEDRGWREQDYGHQCPVCAAEEDEQNALDEATGAESGASYEPTPLVEAVGLDGDGDVRKPKAPAPGKRLRRAK